MKHKTRLIGFLAVCLSVFWFAGTAVAAEKPNILIIWGDDIGQFNVSAYNLGMMGYKTPNIDRIAKEGALFTDWYGQQSCTAGRAAFITGQSPMRTGLTKVGLPSAPEGMKVEDPTIAVLLKHKYWIIGLAILAAVAAAIVSMTLSPAYEATALVAITKPQYEMQFDTRIRPVSGNVQ